MNPSAFISYRRTDAAQAAQSLWAQLRTRFVSRLDVDVAKMLEALYAEFRGKAATAVERPAAL